MGCLSLGNKMSRRKPHHHNGLYGCGCDCMVVCCGLSGYENNKEREKKEKEEEEEELRGESE